MTTSGTITTTLNASQYVTRALKEIGVLAGGEQALGQELEDGLQVFDFMLKSLAADGANLFTDTDGSVTFPAGVATVPLTPNCSEVMEARAVQAPTFERVLARWEMGQYRSIPNKVATGQPTAYVVNHATSATTMTLWPVPATQTVIKYSYARIIEDVTSGEQTIDLPQIWTETVVYNLASRLAAQFGATRTDPAAVARVDQMAATLLGKMLDFDRPSSVFMGNQNGRYF